jgi:hypothetical protein
MMPLPPRLQALIITAPRNRPLESGLVICAATPPAPADWPLMTTLAGSPPKAAMLSWIHFSAAFWSR